MYERLERCLYYWAFRAKKTVYFLVQNMSNSFKVNAVTGTSFLCTQL
jgi:hypothetical protein